MNKGKTLAMLQEVRKNTTDPVMKKDLDNKIKAITENKTVNK